MHRLPRSMSFAAICCLFGAYHTLGQSPEIVLRDDVSPQGVRESWQDSFPVHLNPKVPQRPVTAWTPQMHLKLPVGYLDKRWHDLFPGSPHAILGTSGNYTSRAWVAGKYFKDPSVVRLCEAIHRKDLGAMREAIEQGADVNARGRDDITPLYWAILVDDDPRPFDLLLREDADPNIVCRVTGMHMGVHPGRAVAHLVARGRYNRLFKAVFEHGGNPNLRTWRDVDSMTPLHFLNARAPDAVQRLEVLTAHGADLNARTDDGKTAMSKWARIGDDRCCELVLICLKAGADWRLVYSARNRNHAKRRYRLIHFLVEREAVLPKECETSPNYQALVAWLESRGESAARAKEEIAKWDAGE